MEFDFESIKNECLREPIAWNTPVESRAYKQGILRYHQLIHNYISDQLDKDYKAVVAKLHVLNEEET